jgi:hypothetical protein
VLLGLLGPNACIGYTSPTAKPATTAIEANTQIPNRPLGRFVVGDCAAKSKLVFESTFNQALFFRALNNAALYEMPSPIRQRIIGIPVPNVSTERPIIVRPDPRVLLDVLAPREAAGSC